MLTEAQLQALKWLIGNGGDGCFDRNGVALSGGRSAPIMRSTWNTLERVGLIEFYGGKTGRGRLRITAKANDIDLSSVSDVFARDEL